MQKLKNNNRGETIVEVMMATAIMGLVIVGAFVITRRSLNLGQQATERTQALKIVESQLERIKFLATQPGNDTGSGIFGQPGDYCVAVNGGAMSLTADTSSPDCDHGEFPNSGLEVIVNYDPDGPDASTTEDDNTFTISATWDRFGGDGAKDVVQISYRLHPSVTPTVNSPLTPPAPACGPAFTYDFTANSQIHSSAPITSNHPTNDPWHNWWNPGISSSDPDFDMRGVGAFLELDPGCTYSISTQSYCTDYNRGFTSCPGGDQPNERARITFRSGYNAATRQCTGAQVGYFDTQDTAYANKFVAPNNGILPWQSSGQITVTSTGSINCAEITHICRTQPAGAPGSPQPIPNCWYDTTVAPWNPFWSIPLTRYAVQSSMLVDNIIITIGP